MAAAAVEPARQDANNRLMRREYDRREAVLRCLPNFIMLDSSSRCNLRCPMCWQSIVPEESSPRGDLSQKAFSEALKTRATLSEIIFHGSGEPLLNAHLPDVIAAFRGYPRHMEVCTNGTALTERKARALLGSGLTMLRVSCDADNAGTFERLRKGACWDAFLGNVERAVRIKKELRSRTRLGFNCVVSGHNWSQVPGIVALAERLGLDFVALWAYIAQGEPIGEFVIPGEGVRFVKDFIRRYKEVGSSRCELKSAACFDTCHPVQDRLPDESTTTMGAGGAGRNRDRCGAVYSVMNIKANGDVVPCCINMRIMGNLERETLEDVWNGDEYRRLRKELNAGEPAGTCERCFDGLRYILER